MIWFLILIALIVAIMLWDRRLVRNCPGCRWVVGGSNGYICAHPMAAQASELLQFQAGHWRCPWRQTR